MNNKIIMVKGSDIQWMNFKRYIKNNMREQWKLIKGTTLAIMIVTLLVLCL
jgi:hypothetical protein